MLCTYPWLRLLRRSYTAGNRPHKPSPEKPVTVARVLWYIFQQKNYETCKKQERVTRKQEKNQALEAVLKGLNGGLRRQSCYYKYLQRTE